MFDINTRHEHYEHCPYSVSSDHCIISTRLVQTIEQEHLGNFLKVTQIINVFESIQT